MEECICEGQTLRVYPGPDGTKHIDRCGQAYDNMRHRSKPSPAAFIYEPSETAEEQALIEIREWANKRRSFGMDISGSARGQGFWIAQEEIRKILERNGL